MRRASACLVVALCLHAANPSLCHARQEQAAETVSGALAVGTVTEIQGALRDKGPVTIIPADALQGQTTPDIPTSTLGRRPETDRDPLERRPFVIAVPGLDAPTLATILKDAKIPVEDPPDTAHPWVIQRPGASCPTCLPVDPRVPGGTPALIPALSGRGSDFALDRCGDAANAVRLGARRERDCYKISGFNAAACQFPLDAVARMGDYVHSCTATAREVNDTDLTQFAVLTEDDSDVPFCSALLVTPSLAVTAAHCFPAELPPERVRLRPWSAPTESIEVTLDDSQIPAAIAQLGEGPVVLHLARPVAGAHDKVCFAKPSSPNATTLRLYGYLPSNDVQSATSDDGWATHIRTGAYTCSAVASMARDLQLAMTDHCFRHSCQAFGGFSGAPLFAPPTTPECRTLVVGLHVAAAGSADAPCQDPHTNTALSGDIVGDLLRSLANPPVPQSAELNAPRRSVHEPSTNH